MKILAVDDNKDNLISLRATIKDIFPEAELFSANNGPLGIEMAINENPDLIILDIHMPEMDGFEVCKELKNNSITNDIPVIFVTAVTGNTQNKITSLEVGGEAFLSKPIDEYELTAQIRAMFRIKKARDKNRNEAERLKRLVDERTRKLYDELKQREITELELNKLTTAVIQSPSIFVLTDKEGLITFVNPKFTEVTGYESHEVIGQRTNLLKSGEQSNEFYNQLWNSVKNGNEWKGEFHNKKKNGEKFWETASISPLFDKDNNITGYVKVGEDITVKKHYEQVQSILYNMSKAISATKTLEEFIAAIQKELGALIDTTNMYVAYYNKEDDMLSFPHYSDKNDNFTEISAKNTLTKYVIETEESLLANIELKNKLKKEGKIDFKGSLSKIWLGVPLRVNNEIIGVIAVQSYDDENAYTQQDKQLLEFVSDQLSLLINRKKNDYDLRRALDKANESDRLKSAFLATISHELRTPLNAVIGFSSMIDKNLGLDDILSYAKIINQSGTHLLNIVEDIFDITLIESGQTKITKSEVDLCSIINDLDGIAKIEKQKANKNNLEINMVSALKPKGIFIKTDPAKLKQVLVNLLKNAIKFTLEGRIHYGFKIDKSENNPTIKFFVKDTGIGISEEKQSMIFDMFKQVDDSHTRVFGGTGIGLSISRKLVELLGGDIWVNSELGKGSTFYFTIPYIEVVNKKEEKEESVIPQLLEKSKVNGKKPVKLKTVLIVEDDEMSSEYLKIVLEELGHNTIWAENGQIAVDLCREKQDINLILMDIKMPVMNGYKATELIREFMPDIPIIAQTAYAIAGDKSKVISAGCTDYLSKPVNKKQLIELVNKYLSN